MLIIYDQTKRAANQSSDVEQLIDETMCADKYHQELCDVHHIRQPISSERITPPLSISSATDNNETEDRLYGKYICCVSGALDIMLCDFSVALTEKG